MQFALISSCSINYYCVMHYRPVARFFERGMHVKNMWTSGHTAYNLSLKLSMLLLKYLHHTRLVAAND